MSDCAIVFDLWKFWGKTLKGTVDHSDPTACCTMAGVTCDGPAVTDLNWSSQSLTGSIPHKIGNLMNLKFL